MIERQLAADGKELAGVDAGGQTVEVAPGRQRHDHFFQRRVPGAFADAVDGAFDLPRPFAERGQAVGDGQAQVVVAVDREDAAVDAAHVRLEVPDDRGVVARHGVADGVGNVESGGTGFDRSFDHFGQEIEFGAGRVLGGELDVVAAVAGTLHAFDRPLHHFLGGHAELEFAVDGAGGEEDVDARPGRILDGVGGAVDVGRVAAGQSADNRPMHLAGDGLYRLEIARRGDREARLR